MNLIVEIGNTALKAALAEGTTLGKTFRYQGERMLDYIVSILQREHPAFLTVASAFELSPSELVRLGNYCPNLIVLDSSNKEILKGYGFPEYLSYDRAASLVAVRSLFKGKPVSVVDLGTTLTVDIIDESGAYGGGSISPGCRTRFKALSRYAKSLPLVSLPEENHLSGSSLQSSIESGVVNGIEFEIQGYLAAYPDNIAVFTGGDAIYFAKRMKNSIFAICNLVLIGLAYITEDYVKQHLK